MIATVVGESLGFVALGLVAGLPLAFAAGRAVRAYLFGIDARDVTTIATSCLVVVATAAIAAYLPARRAPRLDPIAALRTE